MRPTSASAVAPTVGAPVIHQWDFARRIDEMDAAIIRAALWEECRKLGTQHLETVMIAYKVYDIEAIYHYESHAVRGGDSYCGMWEQVEQVDREEIEVVGVYEIDDDRNHPELVALLNQKNK